MKPLALMLLLTALCGCATHGPTAQPAAQPEAVASFQPGADWKAPSPKPATAGIAFQGGDGSSIEKAIVIAGAHNESDGVASEYAWLSRHYAGYGMKKQALLQANGKSYDRLDFTTAHGEAKTVYFDISGFFGKF